MFAKRARLTAPKAMPLDRRDRGECLATKSPVFNQQVGCQLQFSGRKVIADSASVALG